MNDDRPDLTPRNPNYTHFPDQTMCRIKIDAVSHFEQGREDIGTCPHAIINEFKPLCFEMAPGATIDWHTHTPAFDEVVPYLDGTAGYTLEREDGSHQVPDIEPRESVYVRRGTTQNRVRRRRL